MLGSTIVAAFPLKWSVRSMPSSWYRFWSTLLPNDAGSKRSGESPKSMPGALIRMSLKLRRWLGELSTQSLS